MNTKNIALQGVFLALLIICSWISLPIGTIPITLSVFAVLLIGGMLSLSNAITVTLIYLLLGLLGLPVFSNFLGGAARLFGPTGGFLLSYPIMVTLVAVFVSINNRFGTYLLGMTLALVICYGFGVTFMIINLKIQLKDALLVGVVPFVVADIIKVAFAATIAYRVKKIKGLVPL